MIKPLSDTIVVKPDPEKKHDFLIMAGEDTKTGVIIAAGPGKKLSSGKIEQMFVSVGDHVMYSGTIDQKFGEFLVMKNKDVIGLVA